MQSSLIRQNERAAVGERQPCNPCQPRVRDGTGLAGTHSGNFQVARLFLISQKNLRRRSQKFTSPQSECSLPKNLRRRSQNVPPTARVAASDFGFLIFSQAFDGPTYRAHQASLRRSSAVAINVAIGGKADRVVHCKCLLLTQSGHRPPSSGVGWSDTMTAPEPRSRR